MSTIVTVQPAAPRRLSIRPWTAVAAWGVILATGAAAAPASPPKHGAAGSSRRPVVDRAVMPAGGGGHGSCGPGGCCHDHARHHRDCRNGACAPHCPVRPSTFGFYGTQWRRWPGQGVVPVSSEQAVTPAAPPRLEVPRAEEESPGAGPAELPIPELPAVPEPAIEQPSAPARDGSETPMEPEPTQLPVAPEPDAAPDEQSPAPPEPEVTTPMAEEEPAAVEPPRELPQADEPAKPAEPAPRPEDENLFDESAASKVLRRIPIATADHGAAIGRPAIRPTAHADRVPADHAPAAVTPEAKPATSSPAATVRRGWLAVPRVAFDPETETARLEAAGPR